MRVGTIASILPQTRGDRAFATCFSAVFGLQLPESVDNLSKVFAISACHRGLSASDQTSRLYWFDKGAALITQRFKCLSPEPIVLEQDSPAKANDFAANTLDSFLVAFSCRAF